MSERLAPPPAAIPATPITRDGLWLRQPAEFIEWRRVRGVARDAYAGEDRPFEVVVVSIAEADGSSRDRVVRWDDDALSELPRLLDEAGFPRPPGAAIDYRTTIWPVDAPASAESPSASLGDDPAFRDFLDGPAFAGFLVRSAERVRARRTVFRRGARALRAAALATVAALIALALFALSSAR